jgi:hypothetical protein
MICTSARPRLQAFNKSVDLRLKTSATGEPAGYGIP